MVGVYKSLNLRLGEPAYEALRELSKKRGVSMNKIVESEVLAAAARERKAQLKVAFGRVAEASADYGDVEYGAVAQSEVVLGDE